MVSFARPPSPLPRGLRCGSREGDYINIKDGSVLVFVPAGMPHRFHDIAEELRLLVVFGPAEGSRAGR